MAEGGVGRLKIYSLMKSKIKMVGEGALGKTCFLNGPQEK